MVVLTSSSLVGNIPFLLLIYFSEDYDDSYLQPEFGRLAASILFEINSGLKVL